MKTYYQNGTCADCPHFIEADTSFCVQEIEDALTEQYIYSGDHINYVLDAELAMLYDTLMELYFPDKAKYYNEIGSIPNFVQKVGQDSTAHTSSDELTILMDEFSILIPDLYRHMYLVDCQFLVGTIQNLLGAMCDNLCNYYVNLSAINLPLGFNCCDGVMTISSYRSRQVCAAIETYFTKAYSILDILCKIAYEFEHPMQDFTTYKKMKCADVLWGARKKLKINKEPGTVFEDCEPVQIIEAIRSEVVHNGTWELNPKVFLAVKDKEIVERYVLFPDFSQGWLSAVKNRKHFFSSGVKVNDMLPQIHKEFMERLLATIKYLNTNAIAKQSV